MKNLFIRSTAMLALLIFGLAFNAHAIPVSVSPSNQFASGNENSFNGAETAAQAQCGCSWTFQYKSNQGGSDEGDYADSYDTVYLNSSNDPSGFKTNYVVAESSIGSTAWLLVKDGNSNPSWYLFNLTALGWTGTEDINGSGFWTGKGAISAVAIYNSPTSTTVPEPSSIVLLGSGLLLLRLLRRRQSAD